MKCPDCEGIITIIADYGVDLFLVCDTDGCNWKGVWVNDAILKALKGAIAEMPQELLETST